MRNIKENLKHKKIIFGRYAVRCGHCGAKHAIYFSRYNELIKCDNCKAIIGAFSMRRIRKNAEG